MPRFTCPRCGTVASTVAHTPDCPLQAIAKITRNAQISAARELVARYEAAIDSPVPLAPHDWPYYAGALSSHLRNLIDTLDKTARGEDL